MALYSHGRISQRGEWYGDGAAEDAPFLKCTALVHPGCSDRYTQGCGRPPGPSSACIGGAGRDAPSVRRCDTGLVIEDGRPLVEGRT